MIVLFNSVLPTDLMDCCLTLSPLTRGEDMLSTLSCISMPFPNSDSIAQHIKTTSVALLFVGDLEKA